MYLTFLFVTLVVQSFLSYLVVISDDETNKQIKVGSFCYLYLLLSSPKLQPTRARINRFEGDMHTNEKKDDEALFLSLFLKLLNKIRLENENCVLAKFNNTTTKVCNDSLSLLLYSSLFSLFLSLSFLSTYVPCVMIAQLLQFIDSRINQK